jgi:hypothetical protein
LQPIVCKPRRRASLTLQELINKFNLTYKPAFPTVNREEQEEFYFYDRYIPTPTLAGESMDDATGRSQNIKRCC